jgi:hypothetical protein
MLDLIHTTSASKLPLRIRTIGVTVMTRDATMMFDTEFRHLPSTTEAPFFPINGKALSIPSQLLGYIDNDVVLTFGRYYTIFLLYFISPTPSKHEYQQLS